MPPADQSVKGSYTAPNGDKVEIEGVCKVTEDSIGCWDAAGRTNEDLRKRVEKALTRDDGFGSSSSLSIAYKKKNRVVVVKTTAQPMVVEGRQTRRWGGSVSVSSIGEGYGGGMIMGLNEPTREFKPDAPRVDYQARCVSVDPSLTTTSAFLNVMEQSPSEATLALVAGATCRIEDARATVVGISKGMPESRRNMYSSPEFMGSLGAVWTIRIKLGNPRSKYRLSFSPATPCSVDEKGRLVSMETMRNAQMAQQKKMAEYYQKPHKPGERAPSFEVPRYRSVYVTPISGNGDGVEYYMINADPKAVKKLKVYAVGTKRIELKGIPLDPR